MNDRPNVARKTRLVLASAFVYDRTQLTTQQGRYS